MNTTEFDVFDSVSGNTIRFAAIDAPDLLAQMLLYSQTATAENQGSEVQVIVRGNGVELRRGEQVLMNLSIARPPNGYLGVDPATANMAFSYYNGSLTGICRTATEGESWSSVSYAYSAGMYPTVSLDGQVTLWDNDMSRPIFSDNKGIAWYSGTARSPAIYCKAYAALTNKVGLVFDHTYGKIYRYDNGSYSEITYSVAGKATGWKFTGVQHHVVFSRKQILVANHSNAYYTEDGGVSWEERCPTNMPSLQYEHNCFFRAMTRVYSFEDDGSGLSYTGDRGLSWVKLPSITSFLPTVNAVMSMTYIGGGVFLGTAYDTSNSRYKIIRSANYGAGPWTIPDNAITPPVSNGYSLVKSFGPGRAAVITTPWPGSTPGTCKVYVTSDYGTSFRELTTDIPVNTYIYDLCYMDPMVPIELVPFVEQDLIDALNELWDIPWARSWNPTFNVWPLETHWFLDPSIYGACVSGNYIFEVKPYRAAVGDTCYGGTAKIDLNSRTVWGADLNSHQWDLVPLYSGISTPLTLSDDNLAVIDFPGWEITDLNCTIGLTYNVNSNVHSSIWTRAEADAALVAAGISKPQAYYIGLLGGAYGIDSDNNIIQIGGSACFISGVSGTTGSLTTNLAIRFNLDGTVEPFTLSGVQLPAIAWTAYGQYGTKLYLCGGKDGANNPLSDLYVIDLNTGVVSKPTLTGALPVDFYDFYGCTVGNKLILNGYDSVEYEVYNSMPHCHVVDLDTYEVYEVAYPGGFTWNYQQCLALADGSVAFVKTDVTDEFTVTEVNLFPHPVNGIWTAEPVMATGSKLAAYSLLELSQPPTARVENYSILEVSQPPTGRWFETAVVEHASDVSILTNQASLFHSGLSTQLRRA